MSCIFIYLLILFILYIKASLIISYILILASLSNLSITDNIKITIMFVTSMSYVLLTKFDIINILLCI